MANKREVESRGRELARLYKIDGNLAARLLNWSNAKGIRAETVVADAIREFLERHESEVEPK